MKFACVQSAQICTVVLFSLEHTRKVKLLLDEIKRMNSKFWILEDQLIKRLEFEAVRALHWNLKKLNYTLLSNIQICSNIQKFVFRFWTRDLHVPNILKLCSFVTTENKRDFSSDFQGVLYSSPFKIVTNYSFF